MEKIISTLKGAKGQGNTYKNEDGFVYWKKLDSKFYITVKCSLWKSGCKAKGKISKTDTTKLVLTIGHENHQQNSIVTKFRNICNERAKKEHISLRIIYNETSSMSEFVNMNVGSFVSHRRTMQRHRKANQPTSPRTMIDFHNQLTGDYAHLPVMSNVPIYMGKIGTNPEEGTTLLFVLPQIKNILRTGSTFLMDGTFAAAPSFNRECQQLYVIMGITFNTGFPIAFALMSRKTVKAYDALFKKLLEIEPQWKPETIIVDFERAV
ncbi:hypothetical protein AGLY_000474 [Aphis glycines]|uniref:MULE transposase domain-containing protein n=1 Tax=Aphis glycines TaxID=307491 RepID=A0A6G0U735_APHGL|nr:hypothetical protein AGLY_000474 [Aphis glycines]